MSKSRKTNSFEKGFTNLTFLTIAALFVGLLTSSLNSQSVLGENEENKKAQEEAKENNKQAEEQQKETQKSQEETQKKQDEQVKETTKSNNVRNLESVKTRTETISPTGVKSKTQTEGKKMETEIETPDGRKIKTKIEDDGKTKVEIEHGALKLKYVVENGQMILKAENEAGQEIELNEDELDEAENEIEDGLEAKGIKISTGSGKPVLAKNNVAAITDFPLSIDVGTNQLIVTTPSGKKVVTILPDQAVQNLLSTNVINKIEQSSDTTLTQELGALNAVVKLEIRNNETVYRVNGIKTHKVLGFIPVNAPTTVFVSAESGNTVAKEQSFLTNLIDLIST